MKRRLFWWVGLAAIALLVVVGWGHSAPSNGSPAIASALVAQAPAAPPEAVPEEAAPAAFPLNGTYEDPQGRFRIAIAEGYSVGSTAGAPLFEARDGSLAYSVVSTPLTGEATLTDIALVEIVRQTFGSGEGFQTQTYGAIAGGGLQMAWTGRLTKGAMPPKPLSGVILAKQQGAVVYQLIIAATEPGKALVPAAVSALAGSLEIL